MKRFTSHKSAFTLLALLAVACLLLSVLVGCGGSGSATGAAVTTAGKPPPQPPPPPSPGADPAIAFVAVTKGGPELWVMNADGSNRTKVVGGATFYSPSWSPDGKQIAFENRDEAALQGSGLYVVSVDGKTPPELLVPAPAYPGYLASPAWSPLGDRIAYVWSYDINAAGGEVRTVPAAGGNWQTLYTFPDTQGVWWGLCWSPEATRLAVVADHDPATWTQPFIGILDLTAGSLTDVTWPTFSRVQDDAPDWARHSNVIAFTGEKAPEGVGLWILDLKSGDSKKLPGSLVRPSWSPDADDSRLVVAKTGSRGGDLWTVEVASGTETLLAQRVKNSQSALREPDWRRPPPVLTAGRASGPASLVAASGAPSGGAIPRAAPAARTGRPPELGGRDRAALRRNR